MRPEVPRELLDLADEWDELHRWERSQLGKALRRLGLTYGEIREIIPVPKGTLSYRCREIDLSDTQVLAICDRTGSETRIGIRVDTQWRRRQAVGAIKVAAHREASVVLKDPFRLAGTALYWAEGSKTKRDPALANTDPHVLRVFIAWVGEYHGAEAEFVLSLHLHEGNDEAVAQSY
jgi:hypothetical protein